MFGAAARQVFGDETVSKFASAAASDANRRLALMDFLAAAFSAAHFVRLTGGPNWTSDKQERMAAELREEVRSALEAGNDVNAGRRAASHRMLTDESPWTEAEMERLRAALRELPGQTHVYKSVAVADQMADYLLLGGPVFWSEDEFHEMRTAVITDFAACVEKGEDILAADRLAVFDVIEANLEAGRTMT
jgi:hypothetical protein